MAAEGGGGDDEAGDDADEEEEEDKVAVEAVKEEVAVADGGDELECGEDAGWKDGGEVEDE